MDVTSATFERDVVERFREVPSPPLDERGARTGCGRLQGFEKRAMGLEPTTLSLGS